MINASELDELNGKGVLLDAGPLQTLFVLHYVVQFEFSNSKGDMHLIRETRPELEGLGVDVYWRTLARFGSYHYTQLALAEALHFREHSRSSNTKKQFEAMPWMRSAPEK